MKIKLLTLVLVVSLLFAFTLSPVAVTKAVAYSPAVTYKVYTALLSQTGVHGPSAIVLANTMDGDFFWERLGTGEYRGTFTPNTPFPPGVVAFDANKTWVIINAIVDGNTTSYRAARRLSDDTITVNTGIGFAFADSLLNKTEIEIRAYTLCNCGLDGGGTPN